MTDTLEDRMRGAIALAFEGQGPAWWSDGSGDQLAALAASVAARVAAAGEPKPLPFPDGPVVLPFEVGPDQDLRAVRFESPADAEAWRAEHAEVLRTAQQPYVRGGRFYAGLGVPEGMVPLVSADVVLADARRVRAEMWGDEQARREEAHEVSDDEAADSAELWGDR